MADYQDNEQFEEEEVSQEEIEKEARSLGWVPEDKFRGPKHKWVDAATYVEKGRVLVPIMRENNDRLKKELSTRDQKIGNLTQQVENLTAQLNRLDGYYAEATKRQVAQAKRELIDRLKTAREDNDVEEEEKIRDQLDDLRAADKKAEAESEANKRKSETKNEQPSGSQLSPEFQEWQKENPWFNDLKDKDNRAKTKQVSRIAEDLQDEGTNLTGRAFLDEVMRLWEEQYGEPEEGEEEEEEEERKPAKRPASKVASSSNRRSSSNGKSFADLPRDAQQACLDDVDTFVGEGKRHKTVDEWKKEYARVYFGSP